MNPQAERHLLPWSKRGWVFDLDGTLTRAILDFPAIKQQLGLPPDRGILESIRHIHGPRLQEIETALAAWELEAVRNAQAADGAGRLLSAVQRRGIRLGILTRNKRDHALETLQVTGLSRFFAESDVLGRDEATPKPSPDGLHKILDQWQLKPDETCMIGDHDIDIAAGRAAGMLTVHVTTEDSAADLAATSLPDLLEWGQEHKI